MSLSTSRKRKAASLREDVPAKLPKCSPRTSKIRRDAFFAGARRSSLRDPLSELSSTIGNELPTSPIDVPSSSPQPIFSSSPLKVQLLTPATTPDVSFLKKLQIARGGHGLDGLDDKIPCRLLDDFQDIKKPRIRKPMPDTYSFRNLHRSLLGYGPDGIHRARLTKRSWITEGFYSEKHDTHMYTHPEQGLQMPFCLSTLNRSPMVAIGYECGGVRLIGTGDWAKDSNLVGAEYCNRGFSDESATILIHDNAIFDLSLSADDRYLASASGDQLCRVNDIERKIPVAILTGHTGSVKQINYSPSDQNLIVTSSRDSNVHIWDLRSVGVSKDETQGTTHKPFNTIYSGHRTVDKIGSVTSAVWSTRNPYQIATACHNDAVVKVWDIRKSHHAKKFPKARPVVEYEAPKPRFHDFKPHRDYGITSLTFSPDGARLYALCKDGNLYAYATSHVDLGPIHFYSHPKLKINTFYVKSAISKDGDIIATGSTDGTVVLFPTEEQYLRPAEDDELPVPHGASASMTAARELRSGTGTALVEGHNGKEVTDVAWDVNGSVMSISDDCVARIWRNDDGGRRAEELRSEKWASGERFGCAWSEGN
ncbi:Jouberin [Orbilia brochopaga]|nr:Jouberin [Drechslerella brochopaga]